MVLVAHRRKRLRWTACLLAGSLAGVAYGCSGKSERSTNGGGDATGGTAGSNGGGTAGTSPAGGSGSAPGGSAPGGSAPTGGTTPAGGTGGSATGGLAGAGTGGTSGAPGGGVSGTGAIAGEGGQPAIVECETAADCRMLSDCCGCRAEPIAEPGFCALPCERDACAEAMIGLDEVACSEGRCVIARSCDRSRATCRSLPPACGEGTTPSVLGSCWGPCLPPTECREVTDCNDCGDALCIDFQAMRSIFSCITREPSCNDADDYCACLGVCGTCSATDESVACPCGGC